MQALTKQVSKLLIMTIQNENSFLKTSKCPFYFIFTSAFLISHINPYSFTHLFFQFPMDMAYSKLSISFDLNYKKYFFMIWTMHCKTWIMFFGEKSRKPRNEINFFGKYFCYQILINLKDLESKYICWKYVFELFQESFCRPDSIMRCPCIKVCLILISSTLISHLIPYGKEWLPIR